MKGTCKLCGNNKELRKSHIIPSFVYKWLKETSGTGAIRLGEKPNLRVQDGPKFYWLCEDCEGIFNTWETQFANNIFHPLINVLNDSGRKYIPYGSWLLKFAVSVSWRVLNYFIDEKDLLHFPEKLQVKANNAILRWKEFLLDQAPHPAQFEQHMLPSGPVVNSSVPNTPTNINRYLLRSIDIDAVHAPENNGYVYSKMGPFILVGFIDMSSKQWKGTKLHVNKGVFGSRRYSVPGGFGKFIMGKANRMEQRYRSMSPNQRQRIDDSYRKHIDKAIQSGSVQAMSYDVGLFGDIAFEKEDETDT